MLHIGPIADGIAHMFPFALVLPNGLLALFNKWQNSVALYLLLAVEAEGFFHLKLNGEAMGIPSGLAENVIALHRAVSGDNVLHGTGQHMPDMRTAVCCGRAVIEGIGRLSPALPYRFFKDVVLFPEFQHLTLSFNEIERCRNLFVHKIPP